MASLSVKFVNAYLLKVLVGMYQKSIKDNRNWEKNVVLPGGNDKINHHGVELVLGDLVSVDVVSGVDGLSLHR